MHFLPVKKHYVKVISLAGVYSHQLGTLVGSHAVKMLGWGSLNGEDYWFVDVVDQLSLLDPVVLVRILANSWNTDWGMGGFVLFKRGGNECNIEASVVAGLPRL